MGRGKLTPVLRLLEVGAVVLVIVLCVSLGLGNFIKIKGGNGLEGECKQN